MNLETLELPVYIITHLFKCLLLVHFISCINNKHFIRFYIISIPIYFIFDAYITTLFSSSISSILFILSITSLYTLINKLSFSTNLLIFIISISVNNILFITSVALNYPINKFIFQISDYLNAFLIAFLHLLLQLRLLKINQLRIISNSIIQKSKDGYFNLIIFNISVIIIFLFIFFINLDISIYKEFFPPLVIFAILMIVTIYYSVKQYYKQKLFNAELRESKQKIELMKNEITRLETENLSYSKINHTLKHKQRALEYKAATLAFNSEIANELTPIIVPALFNSTEIKELDDLFSYMQAECNKNEIDLELQIKCNLFELINNFISLEDLETLLSDHIRNSIIALNNSNNINKSLLVKIGQYNSCYVISIYDSGIEFKLSTLEKLGTTPITTHSGTGGSGLGFMNTFDTLKKYEITMEINEIGEESVDNYTKSITFIFNKTFDFNIKSYRKNS